MTEDPKPVRRRCRRPSARRRGRFLQALAASGNVCEAAAATGFPRATIYKLRRQDAEFARAMAAAAAAAGARLEAEGDEGNGGTRTFSRKGTCPQGTCPDGTQGMVIRRGRGGRNQLVTAGGHWCDKRADAVFLAHFRASGNGGAICATAG